MSEKFFEPRRQREHGEGGFVWRFPVYCFPLILPAKSKSRIMNAAPCINSKRNIADPYHACSSAASQLISFSAISVNPVSAFFSSSSVSASTFAASL